MCFFIIIAIIIVILYLTNNLPGAIKTSIDNSIAEVNYELDSFRSNDLLIGGYYQSWSSKYTSNPEDFGLANYPSFINRIYISFANPNLKYSKGSNTFSNTGLDFSVDFNLVKNSILIAKSKNTKLKIILSIGGATFHFNNEKTNFQEIIDLMNDLSLDGIDIDYENNTICENKDTTELKCSTDNDLISIITNFRILINKENEKLKNEKINSDNLKILSAAAFSVGAYCTKKFPNSKFGPVSDYCGMWVNPLIKAGKHLDELNIMSYDAGKTFSAFDSFDAYKSIFNRAIRIGIEVPPEAWGGDFITIQRAVEYAKYSKENNGAGVFVWSFNKIYNELNSYSYLKPICEFYGLAECNKEIPLK